MTFTDEELVKCLRDELGTAQDVVRRNIELREKAESKLARATEALRLARERINRLSHVIKRDQNALWNGTQLGPATDDDLKEINTTLAEIESTGGGTECDGA